LHEQERRQAQELERRTAGISYSETLQAVPSKGDGDKITLPTSALQALTSQDATGLGPMLFELSIAAKHADEKPRVTHGGVLEFVAVEGTVGLPLKVLHCNGVNA
jgi:Ubiquitin fusion degradation protein UFD1